MAPLRSWVPVGQRLHAKVPYGHWRTITFLAALRCNRIGAPCVLDQPINAQSLTDYVDQCLVPTLSLGDIAIMDNLSSHKNSAIREAIRAVGAELLSLLPYSPDQNSIEQVFAKLKHLIGKAAKRLHEKHGAGSVRFSTPFPPQSAVTILLTREMLQPNVITL